MNANHKTIVVGIAAAVAGGLIVRECVRSSQHDRSDKIRARLQERMRRRMAQMPEDFPPRIVHDLVPAIKADTAQILELLGEARPPRDEAGSHPS